MGMIFGIISVESVVPFSRIDKIELHAKVNEHTWMRIWGILEEKDALAIIEKDMENEVIKVTLSDGQVYFVGSVVELEVKEQSSLFQAYMVCISTSFLLDIYPHDRSYQDVGQSYEDVIRKSLIKERNVLFIAGKEAERSIEKPIFQYCETGWAFLLRMASDLQTYVIADHRAEYPAFSLGEIKKQEAELEVKDHIVGHDEDNGKTYTFTSIEQRNVGDYMLLRGQILMIVEKHSIFQDGGSVNTYVLGSKQGFSAKDHSCSLKGCQLRGTVLDTDGERIKLHLEIDEDQDIDKAYWFEYAPQSGNVMYCMPQKGTKAMLRFCSDQDDPAVVEVCWRENGDKCQDMADYRKRYFTTEHGKRMAMLPDAIFFQGDDDRMDLEDRLGISLSSGKSIRIVGEEWIDIIASQSFDLKGSRHIYITKPDTHSVIDLAADEINIDSVNTNLDIRNTDVDKPYSPYHPLPAISIQARLARKALAFAPRKSGKDKL